MTIYELAKQLDGEQYGYREPLGDELAKELGFVIISGYSDDICRLDGAISDEVDCYNGGVITHPDLPETIKAVWDSKERNCSWCYETTIPHAEFEIYEGDELYCIGLVIDLKQTLNNAKCPYCECGAALTTGDTNDKGIAIKYPNTLIAYGYDVHGSGSNGLTVKINNCPMCGRKLQNTGVK